MALKIYQERVVKEVRTYLAELAKEQGEGNLKHAAKDAWENLRIPRSYRAERRNGIGKDLPTFCVKVPTGGGKTLLATQILGEIYKTILTERNGTGLVLWVVPSDQIYRDTLKALRDRRHFYRESLEFALSRRIEVWEKHQIVQLTPSQLATCLNILIIKLQGTNRQDKESLKFFRDSGGNIMAHFPPEDEPDAHRSLKKRISNLEMLEENPDTGVFLTKTSIGNLVRLCEPAVVLDEGHKATSKLALETIEGFNPKIVVELSATPHADANVLVNVTGQELLDEEMIKLPMNIANSNQHSWKDVLSSSKDQRERLNQFARDEYQTSGKLIRPIVLVQVERTGKEQRDGKHIHSLDVKDHLMLGLGIEERAIAIKTSDKDDIEGIDLMDEDCAIEWIITKAALQEGWDCPFAYILVSLANTQSQQSMTQLVGRVLRQPYQQKMKCNDLNESYVFCLQRKASDISREVKAALEKEGYEGSSTSVIDRSDGNKTPDKRPLTIRERYKKHYKSFEGRIFLPRFCVKSGDGYVPLDYFIHLLSHVQGTDFLFDEVSAWDFTADIKAAKEQFYSITLGMDKAKKKMEMDAELLESDKAVKSWMVANLPFEWFSARQLVHVVNEVCKRLSTVTGKLALVKFPLRNRIEGFIQRHTDRITEQAFRQLHEQGDLCFFLESREGCFEIPGKVSVRYTKKLRHDNDDDVQKSLFDYVPADDLNDYEKSVALYLDRDPQVLWWYRNLVGSSNFSIQGYRRNRIYPDFVVQQGDTELDQPTATVLVVESKGQHLKGSEDTNYKRTVAGFFENVGQEVKWQDLGQDFEKNTFRFQILDEGEYADKDWRGDLKKILEM